MKLKKSPLKINREYIIKIIIEVFSVVFAVLLALWVNEWQQNKQNKILVEQANRNMQDEILVNKERIENTIPIYNSFLNELDSVILLYENSTSLEKPTTTKLSLSLVTQIAWEAIKATDAINFMDFDLIITYSSLYSVQSIYMNQIESYIYDKTLNIESKNKEEALNKIKYQRSILSQIENTSEQLLDLYNKIIEYIEEE